MKSFGDRCGIIRLIIISLYIDLVLSETVFERRIAVDVGVYISTPWERRIFRLVSHWRCVVMHDALPFLFIAIQIGSLSLCCDILKISLIYVFPALNDRKSVV